VVTEPKHNRACLESWGEKELLALFFSSQRKRSLGKIGVQQQCGKAITFPWAEKSSQSYSLSPKMSKFPLDSHGSYISINTLSILFILVGCTS